MQLCPETCEGALLALLCCCVTHPAALLHPTTYKTLHQNGKTCEDKWSIAGCEPLGSCVRGSVGAWELHWYLCVKVPT